MNHNIAVIDNNKYMAVRQGVNTCKGCVAREVGSLCGALPACSSLSRPDGVSVIFKPYHGKRIK